MRDRIVPHEISKSGYESPFQPQTISPSTSCFFLRLQAVRRVATEAPLMSAEGSAFEETTPSPPTTASSRGGGGGVRSASHIRDCEVTTIELPWKPNASLGISFVGGSDTPLVNLRFNSILICLQRINLVIHFLFASM